MKPQPILHRYAFYRCAGGRRHLMAVLNTATEAAGWEKLGEYFPNYEQEEWIATHVGVATTGPSAA